MDKVYTGLSVGLKIDPKNVSFDLFVVVVEFFRIQKITHIILKSLVL
jgi:hypothetical protein